MATEVLVTEFRLNDKMSAGLRNLDNRVKLFLGNLGKGDGGVKGFTRGIGQIGSVSGAAVAAVAGLGLGVGALVNSASQAAAEFDTMSRKFSGAFGSVDAGAQAMRYLESYATKSAFGLGDLADAATQLAVVGLDINRFLPILERFALVVSGTDPQGLSQVAGALARIRGGSFGEAMEVFRRAGVGATDLRQQGISVSKGGEIQATADQVFAAIERISQGRLKAIADAISGGDATARSNAEDAAARAFRQFGTEVNKILIPALQAFTQELSVLIDSGAIKRLTEEFVSLGAAFQVKPGLMEDLLVGFVDAAHAITTFASGVQGVADFIEKLIPYTPGYKFLDDLSKIFNGMPIKEAFGLVYGTESGEEIRQLIEEARKRAKVEEPAPLPVDQGAATSPMVQVADNTKKLVDLQKQQVDLSRQILGGGVAATEAASAVRLDQAIRGTGGGSRGQQMLMAAVKQIVADVFGQDIAARRNSGVRSAQVR
jgi:hypothetical protein